jgi:WD40 repeat protein
MWLFSNMKWQSVFVTAMVVTRHVAAQLTLSYINPPTSLWTDFTSAAGNKNGLFLSPSNSILVSIARDCTIRALNPLTGALVWNAQTSANAAGESFACTSGVVFSPDSSYLAYMVSDNPGSADADTRYVCP